MYIETKGPSFHDRVGLPLEGKLLSALEAAGYWRAPDIPVVLQSFEEQACTCAHAAATCFVLWACWKAQLWGFKVLLARGRQACACMHETLQCLCNAGQ